MILIYISLSILVLYALALVFFSIMGIKNDVTFCNHYTISNAIFKYHNDCIEHGNFEYNVDWSDMEDYDKTFWRLWDWGYKRILPKEKFEYIKDYINKEKQK